MRDKKLLLTFLLCLSFGIMSGQIYKKFSKDDEERTRDFLSRMTLDEQSVVEPGSFKLMIGSASDDIRLSGTIEVD